MNQRNRERQTFNFSNRLGDEYNRQEDEQYVFKGESIYSQYDRKRKNTTGTSGFKDQDLQVRKRQQRDWSVERQGKFQQGELSGSPGSRQSGGNRERELGTIALSQQQHPWEQEQQLLGSVQLSIGQQPSNQQWHSDGGESSSPGGAQQQQQQTQYDLPKGFASDRYKYESKWGGEAGVEEVGDDEGVFYNHSSRQEQQNCDQRYQQGQLHSKWTQDEGATADVQQLPRSRRQSMAEHEQVIEEAGDTDDQQTAQYMQTSDYGNNQPCKWEDEEQQIEKVSLSSSEQEQYNSSMEDRMYDQSSVDRKTNELDAMVEKNKSCSESPFNKEDKAIITQHLYNMLMECRSVDAFVKERIVAEGAYGIVYRARERTSGKIMALKKVKFHSGERNGFPITSIREINLLLSLQHPNIVKVDEVVVGKTLNDVFMVMEWMDYDLRTFIEKYKQTYHTRFSTPEVKQIILQLLNAVDYLHEEWVFHRDIKTSNILYDNKGTVKLCDFGLARQYASPLRNCTPVVVTRWYRAPEVLFGQRDYSEKIDTWALGCIMGELIAGEALFPGKSDLDQIDKILSIMGTPQEQDWPGFSKLPNVKRITLKQYPCTLREKFPKQSILGQPWLSSQGYDLLCKLLSYDPNKRISMKEALQHPWFTESPKPTPIVMMPTLPTPQNAGRGFMIR